MNKLFSRRRIGKSVRNFSQYLSSCQQMTVKLLREGNGTSVGFIGGTQKSDEIKRVGEDGSHRFGRPWT